MRRTHCGAGAGVGARVGVRGFAGEHLWRPVEAADVEVLGGLIELQLRELHLLALVVREREHDATRAIVGRHCSHPRSPLLDSCEHIGQSDGDSHDACRFRHQKLKRETSRESLGHRGSEYLHDAQRSSQSS